VNYTIYRISDASGNLLYVGQTNDPERRLEEHIETKPWLPDEFHVTLERGYQTRDSVTVAEENAIKSERPRHNIVHNKMRAAREQVLVHLWFNKERASLAEIIIDLFGLEPKRHRTIDALRVHLAVKELLNEKLLEEDGVRYSLTEAGKETLLDMARGIA